MPAQHPHSCHPSATMGPPAELLQGRAGPEAWRKAAKATVQAAQDLHKGCAREALSLWRPPGQPKELPHERRARLQSWHFKLDVTETGETLEKPPEGPGVTLWKSKTKPPPWVSQLPLPCFRDFCTSTSNRLAHRYCSTVRLMVSRLRQALSEVSQQAKHLVVERKHLDTALAKVRTALLTNRQSATVRGYRPQTEQAPDQVDALLQWERKELQKLKVRLEGDMAMSEKHLQALDKCQRSLGELCEERGCVLELMGQPLHRVLLESGRDSWLSLTRPSSPNVDRNPTPEPNPIGPYTPECAAAIEEARRLTVQSKKVLTVLKEDTVQATATLREAQAAIDGSLQRKMNETMALKERLYMVMGGMRSTLNRCQRFHDEMSITHGMTMGPESSKYQETREKLTRPIVRVYQRHVGTQLPEANILTQGSTLLESSMQNAARNVERMQHTKEHLRSSIHDKQMGFDVDASIQRLRRRRMHPRSTMDEASQLTCS
ncbi:tektin-like protein 1 [Alligator mississippiensis]|uniref:tektin-like protein 1 n=1 Tax=Alligator mississippiensis TaxID=8496 RepID=UPI002877696C|nr:tektin-like protein 1 [Alligator mississippiensis]